MALCEVSVCESLRCCCAPHYGREADRRGEFAGSPGMCCFHRSRGWVPWWPAVPLETELKLHCVLTWPCLVMLSYLGINADGIFL